ncbi:hypothetical protein KWAN_197 [Erwinia phage vB_EamM_Kwan]|jgi:hypothetical protein|uniref:Uncharacterized protein n=1 Tax=Erwinia phage vB_EamM_Kwan TaxID=1883374 RepID=A0A1B2IE71_9CAUD|nr:hypothetical protein BIZ80_gp102 [Erwinia phage vB_EamM_Kwan]ANZ49549.1 hypothetical protein KWAN_197 [Erwinia phage vB_EamM_Kwan]
MKVTAFLAVPGKSDSLPELTPSYTLVKDATALKASIDRQRGESSDPYTLIETEVNINRFFVNDRKGIYVKLQQIEDLMGRDFAITFAVRNEHEVQKTPHYKKIRELNPGVNLRSLLKDTLPVLPDVDLLPGTVFGNKQIVERLIKEGYDGASLLGSDGIPQYFVFSAEQLKVKRTSTV